MSQTITVQPAEQDDPITQAEHQHRPVLVVDFGAQYAQLIARRAAPAPETVEWGSRGAAAKLRARRALTRT